MRSETSWKLAVVAALLLACGDDAESPDQDSGAADAGSATPGGGGVSTSDAGVTTTNAPSTAANARDAGSGGKKPSAQPPAACNAGHTPEMVETRMYANSEEETIALTLLRAHGTGVLVASGGTLSRYDESGSKLELVPSSAKLATASDAIGTDSEVFFLAEGALYRVPSAGGAAPRVAYDKLVSGHELLGVTASDVYLFSGGNTVLRVSTSDGSASTIALTDSPTPTVRNKGISFTPSAIWYRDLGSDYQIDLTAAQPKPVLVDKKWCDGGLLATDLGVFCSTIGGILQRDLAANSWKSISDEGWSVPPDLMLTTHGKLVYFAQNIPDRYGALDLTSKLKSDFQCDPTHVGDLIVSANAVWWLIEGSFDITLGKRPQTLFKQSL